MKRLSEPSAEPAPFYDAIVVGSGYGGGVAASRLARMGLSVAVFERGEEILPGEFPDTADKAVHQLQASTRLGHIGRRTGLFDLHVGEDLNVLVGCGLGGTSLINANVSLRADPRVLDDLAWPAALRDADLAEGYTRAEAMLKPRPYPDDGVGPAGGAGWPHLNKLQAMKSAADAFATPLVRPPINVAFTEGYNAAGVWQPACNLCGDCCSGCNTGAKTTTHMTYLPDAAAHGAKIFCGVRVRWIERAAAGWTLGYVPQGMGREVFEAPELLATARIVVLAAGTLGSTEILLRSRERGLSASTKLGSRMSGNGDVLAFGYNNDTPIDGIGLGYKAAAYDWRKDSERPVGPTITGLIDLRKTDDLEAGMVIEEGSIPGGIANFLPAVMAVTAGVLGRDTDAGDFIAEKMREIESVARGPYKGAVNHTQTFLVMSHDGAEGTMRLVNDALRVEWPGVGDKPGFVAVARNLSKAVAASGGTYVPNPIWTDLMKHELVTVHPLGGCPMGNGAESGVVDDQCRVYAGVSGTAVHPGLYVCDGSVMPRSLGVNPLLTISAVSERAMIKLAVAEGRSIDMSPATPQAAGGEEPEKTIGIRFTEKMTGHVIPASGGAASAAQFVVTVAAADAQRFLLDKAHEAELSGTVEIPALSAQPLTVHDGSFNLFTALEDGVETKQMEYRMPLADSAGKRYFLHGRKLVHDDPGFDLWRDVTTLLIDVHDGPDEHGVKLLAGTLIIEPMDFVRQLRTMTVTDAPDLASRLETMRRFGFFFAGQLFESFGGPFARPSLYDPKVARPKRPLRVGMPEVHHFQTTDGLTLRFTRYRGGTKGPLILSHGLGVSSLIFTIDTIDTNLLEYLFAGGYDCWVLDYRASIDLPYATDQNSADDVAEKDYPAAVAYVRGQTGGGDVLMVAHCYGAMTFAMSMLRGLPGIRGAVISQIATHADVPFFPQRLLAYLHTPDLMKLVGTKALDARAATDRGRLAHFIDNALAIAYPFNRDDHTRSATSRRITALYGQLYQLDQLNQRTLDAMPEMFGKANLTSFRHLAHIARKGHVVRADGTDDYVTDANLRHFAVPTLFVHGARNRAFEPSGTKKTRTELARVNGAGLYERVEIAETGHIDCIFGKNAIDTVYPAILAHLDRIPK